MSAFEFQTKSVSQVFCDHDKYPSAVDQETGEIACTNCGVVINQQEVEFTETSLGKESRSNLYLDIGPGTKSESISIKTVSHDQNNRKIKIFDSKQTTASEFSNMCDKLGFPRSAYLEAWSLFSKLIKIDDYKCELCNFVSSHDEVVDHLDKVHKADVKQKKCLHCQLLIDTNSLYAHLEVHTKTSIQKISLASHYGELIKSIQYHKASIALFALHIVCRNHSLPIEDKKMQEAIKMNFSVKRVSTVLKAFSDLKVRAEELKICTSTDNPTSYYLNLYLVEVRNNHGLPENIFNKFKNEVYKHFQQLAYVTNSRKRAKLAIKIALPKFVLTQRSSS